METPLISVIVPVYNVKQYLSDCVKSIIRQTYPKLEIILVDDGSTDGSGAECDQYAKKDPRIRVVHQQNLGLSAARNRGLRESTGRFITFVDSDDYLTADYIQYLFMLIRKYQADLSICALSELKLSGKRVNYGEHYTEKAMSPEESLGKMLREEGFTVVAYAKLYKRELWQNVAFPEGAIHEDLNTTYKLIIGCSRIAYGPEPKYIYRKRQNSISNTEFSDQKFSIIAFTDAMCDDIASRYPYLKNTTLLRRCHARFSVLRQLPKSGLSPAQLKKEQEIIAYLKSHKNDILKNPDATSRDKFAMRLLLLGKSFFKLSWKIYSHLRR